MGKKKKSKAYYRRKATKNKWGLGSRQILISYLDSVRFEDESDEEFRKSLCRAYARGNMSDAQWYYARELQGRHRRAAAIKKRVAKPKDWAVYVARTDMEVKIGFTGNLNSRISEIQVGCPYPIEIDRTYPCATHEEAKELEGELHGICDAHRIRGEWFRIEALNLLP